MKLLTKFGNAFDRINDFLFLMAAVVLLFLVLSISYAVFTRYVLGFTTKGLFQIWEYSLLYLPFLGAAWLLRREGHVGVDIVVRKLRPQAQIVVNFITSVLNAVICLIIAWYGSEATLKSFQTGVSLLGEIMVPKYLILMIIPIGSFLFAIQFLRRAYGYFLDWGASPDKEQGLPVNPQD